MTILELMKQVHSCKKCSKYFGSIIKYYPVFSFGDPQGKEIIVIGLNPSTNEYEKGYLLDTVSPKTRSKNQLEYFKKPYYKYFFGKIEDFFGGSIKETLGYKKYIWEKVGYLDLVKCPTSQIIEGKKKQWSGLEEEKEEIVNNCKNYLLKQLEIYKPKLIIPYGKDICEEIAKIFNVYYSKYHINEILLDGHKIKILFLYQVQRRSHSEKEIQSVREKISSLISK